MSRIYLHSISSRCHVFVGWSSRSLPSCCSLSRRSASWTSLERTRLNSCPSAHWSGISGCLANPTPHTGNEPNIYTYRNEEHTPINLPDSHRNVPRRDDAFIIPTTEDPEGFPHSGTSSSSKHSSHNQDL